MNLFRAPTLAIAVLLGLALPGTQAGCGSTDKRCDRACEAWSRCRQVEGNYVNYDYDTCYQECQDEGDWGPSYVRCVEKYETCPEIENNCG